MRISDWSSDVCSSDLIRPRQQSQNRRVRLFGKAGGHGDAEPFVRREDRRLGIARRVGNGWDPARDQILDDGIGNVAMDGTDHGKRGSAMDELFDLTAPDGFWQYAVGMRGVRVERIQRADDLRVDDLVSRPNRKSTRLNSSH